MTIPLPTTMSLSDWADQVAFGLDSYGSIAKLIDDDWQRWGAQLMLLTRLSTYNLPNPYNFDDWLTWAQRVADALN